MSSPAPNADDAIVSFRSQLSEMIKGEPKGPSTEQSSSDSLFAPSIDPSQQSFVAVPERKSEEDVANLFKSLREELTQEIERERQLDIQANQRPLAAPEAQPAITNQAPTESLAAHDIQTPVVASIDESCTPKSNQPVAAPSLATCEFVPAEPQTLQEAGLAESQVAALLLKTLMNLGTSNGRAISQQIALSFRLTTDLLRQLKDDKQVVIKGESSFGDYTYELTELGMEWAQRYAKTCTYWGAAPVPLEAYSAAVLAQSGSTQRPTLDDLKNAFNDLLISPDKLSKVAQAVTSGRGLFLYGSPGNGKTSIAERITKAFGNGIWIPRALFASGEIVRLYDESCHELLELSDDTEGTLTGPKHDHRWLYIRRPTVVAGGELTMSSLDILFDKDCGISEAPLQLKSNCGTLVIDDFGRQQASPTEVLNRWIVPLEKRHDYLNLGNGRKIQVPFDQLIVFSTNLEPRDLVDEAFLRRIPYKIDVRDASEAQFMELFRSTAQKLGLDCPEPTLKYLMDKHYRAINRPMRFCQPRDLLAQVENFLHVHQKPAVVTIEAIDEAVDNYFSVL